MSAQPLLALVMIVKNEAESIQRTLASVRPYIDRYVILDTGSTDGTPELIRQSVEGLPGELHFGPFIDYGTTRNRVLELAGQQAVFTLMLSGDETLEHGASLRSFLEAHRHAAGPEHGAYYLRVRLGIHTFDNARVARSRDHWRYVGATHEVLIGPGGLSPTLRIPDARVIHVVKDQARKLKTWQADLELLRREAQKYPHDTRTHFYLAQTLEALEQYEEAEQAFRRRIELGGWQEEVYESLLRLARVARARGRPWPEVQQLYLDAHTHSPHRAEPLYEIAWFWYQQGNAPLAYLFASRGARIPYPEQAHLFVDEDVYRFKLPDLVQALAHQFGDYAEGEAAARRALEYLPSDERMRQNVAFYERVSSAGSSSGEQLALQRKLAHAFEPSAEQLRMLRSCWVPYFEGCQSVLDIGCGEGVLLELLRDAGIPAEGIDMDPARVAAAAARGLRVTQARLQDVLPTHTGSHDGVFLGHIIEHLSGPEGIELLSSCRRVLRPGGLLILLTPNFQDPRVSGVNFWLDLTHQRPYPLQLLQRMLESLGLEVVESGPMLQGLDLYLVGRVPGGAPRRWRSTRTPPAEPQPMEPATAPRVRMSLVGDLFFHSSLALVNRELSLALLRTGAVELALRERMPPSPDLKQDPRFAPLAERLSTEEQPEAQVHVRHQWPPNFERPRQGKLVLIQPWDLGGIPREWLAPLRDTVDELWVPTEQVRRFYVDSGVPSGKVFVVPNGVDPRRFRPDVAPMELPTRKRFRFLFVGGTIPRKGVDVLLSAYLSAFSPSDDVSLIIKELGQTTFYQGQGIGVEIARLARDPNTPEVVHLPDTITDEAMPSLYTACDVLVHSYRGEGFALPVAEALACGRPVIITRGGACDDFCSDADSYGVPAPRRTIEISMETEGPAWVLEPDVTALAARMRATYEAPQAAREKGARGSAWVHEHLTWDVAARVALRRLRALTAQPER